MSQRNVDVVQRGFQAMNRGDTEAVLDGMDPAIEWYPTEDFVDIGPFRGHDGIRQLMTLMVDTFENYAIEPEELINAGDKVVAPVHQTGSGAVSGLLVDVRYILVFTLHDGKAVRVDSYYDRAQALQAAGLPTGE